MKKYLTRKEIGLNWRKFTLFCLPFDEQLKYKVLNVSKNFEFLLSRVQKSNWLEPITVHGWKKLHRQKTWGRIW